LEEGLKVIHTNCVMIYWFTWACQGLRNGVVSDGDADGVAGSHPTGGGDRDVPSKSLGPC